MAKPAVAEQEVKQEVATTVVPSGPPAELASLMEKDRDKGVSKAQEDNLVPLIYILQGLSPQVQRRNAAYIEGAEPGSFWLRHASNPIVPGEQGITVIPCYFSKSYNEWVPRDSGGGFVGRHREVPSDVTERADSKNPNKTKMTRPNGNEVIETREHVVLVVTPQGLRPYVLPFSSTGHTTSRQWMFMLNSHGGAPSFSRKYLLTTKERTNPSGTWFGVEVKDLDWVSTEEYKVARTLNEAFETGAKQTEAHAEDVAAENKDAIPF